MSTHRPAAARFALGLAGLVMVVSGCELASPTPIITPYPPSDGTSGQVSLSNGGTVELRNFLVVGSTTGQPGVVLGAVASRSPDPVQVQLSVLDYTGNTTVAQTTVTAKPGELVQIGPDGKNFQVQNMPLPAGTLLKVRAETGSGGTEFTLPVMSAQYQYRTITPSAVVTPAVTPPATSHTVPVATPATS